MRSFPTPVTSCLLALALSGACEAAFAADVAPAPSATKPAAKAAKTPDSKSKESSFGKGTGALLTRDQLRQCMTEQGRLRAEAADVVLAQRALEADKTEIDRSGKALKAQMETLDRTSQAAVDAFNAEAQAREKLIDGYQAATPLFNDRVDKLESARASWAKDCADRRYREDDLDAIKAGK